MLSSQQKSLKCFLTLALCFPVLLNAKSFVEYHSGIGRTQDVAIQSALTNGINAFYGVRLSDRVVIGQGGVMENRRILVRESETVRFKVVSLNFTDKFKTDYKARLEITFDRYYPIEGCMRSVVVPGWGQYYKGSPVKGSTALLGVTGLVATGVLTANHSTEMNDRFQSSTSSFKRNYYNEEATKYHQISVIAYGLAAGLYVLNIWDSIAAPLGYKSRLSLTTSDMGLIGLTYCIYINE